MINEIETCPTRQLNMDAISDLRARAREDLRHRDPQTGDSWLHRVIRAVYDNIFRYQMRDEADVLLRELVADGLDPNAVNATGDTPLHVASVLRDDRLYEILLVLGADPGRPNKVGLTAREAGLASGMMLYEAVLSGRLGTVEASLALGADPLWVSPHTGQSVLDLARQPLQYAEDNAARLFCLGWPLREFHELLAHSVLRP